MKKEKKTQYLCWISSLSLFLSVENGNIAQQTFLCKYFLKIANEVLLIAF